MNVGESLELLACLSLSLLLRPTVSRPVCLEIKHPSVAYYQIFISVRELRVRRCGALSLMRGQVCHLQLLVGIASAVILGSESRGTRDYILLSQFLSPPMTRRATVEVFDPASTWDTSLSANSSCLLLSAERLQNT
jgi:hypothetical protein